MKHLTTLAALLVTTCTVPALAEVTQVPLATYCTDDMDDITDEMGSVVSMDVSEINPVGYAIVHIFTLDQEVYAALTPDGKICVLWNRPVTGA